MSNSKTPINPVALAPALRKGSVNRWKRLRGIWDRTSGVFKPFPLTLNNLEINDDSFYSVEISLAKDDPDDWCMPKGTPLVIEFKARFFLAGREDGDDLSALLIRRARQQHVEPEQLPKRCVLEESEVEETALTKALVAVRDAVWYPILRWANWREVADPNGLHVPAKVPVLLEAGDSADGYVKNVFPRGFAPVEWAITDPELNRRARKKLDGPALAAFDQYDRYWHQQHGVADHTAHDDGDDQAASARR
jgi:hypothetical protein